MRTETLKPVYSSVPLPVQALLTISSFVSIDIACSKYRTVGCMRAVTIHNDVWPYRKYTLLLFLLREQRTLLSAVRILKSPRPYWKRIMAEAHFAKIKIITQKNEGRGHFNDNAPKSWRSLWPADKFEGNCVCKQMAPRSQYTSSCFYYIFLFLALYSIRSKLPNIEREYEEED